MSWFTSWFTASKPLTEAERCFTKEELDALHAHIRHAAHAGQGRAPVHLDLPAFASLCQLPAAGPQGALTQALFRVACNGQATADAQAIIEAKARCAYMGEDAARDFAFTLLCTLAWVPAAQSLTHVQLQAALGVLCAFLLGCAPVSLPQPLLAAVTEGALRHAAGPACSAPAPQLTREGYARWVKALPAVHQALVNLLGNVGRQGQAQGGPAAAVAGATSKPAGLSAGSSSSSHMPPGVPVAPPRLVGSGTLGEADFLLHPLTALLLAGCLPQDMREGWRLLFHSQRDGKSFQTFMGRLTASPGPTLLLLRDKGGHVLGGYAPQPWKKSGAYFGDATSFVFGVQPASQVFPATGINTNIQWCGVGFSELPNGVGFGGAQGGHGSSGQFAVYVDSTLDSGMSRPIATFGSPSLASTQVFEVDAVECWLVREPEEDPSAQSGPSRRGGSASVLDRQQDRAFMGLAGFKADHSAGVRDAPPESEL